MTNKKFKKTLIFIIILMISAACATFFFYQKQPPKQQYLTHTAGLANIESTVIAGGQVYAEELIDVGAQATGRVDRLHVKLGQRVKKGEPIADIDANQQKNALKDDEASYKSLLAQHDIKKIQLAQIEHEFNQQKQGYQAGVVAKIDYTKAKTALSTAQKELSASMAQLEQAKLKIATAKTNLAYTRITAPMDGDVC